MQAHYWEDDTVEYEVKISKGFTELKPSIYTASATEEPLNFRVSPKDKSNMSKFLFGGFTRCLYPLQKFDSEATAKHKGKPWVYALIPHDVIAENMTLLNLVSTTPQR